MKRTESTVYPERTQLLQGVLLVNYDVQEVVKTEEDGTEYTMYTYAQDRLQKEATESDVEKAIAKGMAIMAKEYLGSTDWYVTRNNETGVEVPAEVVAKRQECRELL